VIEEMSPPEPAPRGAFPSKPPRRPRAPALRPKPPPPRPSPSPSPSPLPSPPALVLQLIIFPSVARAIVTAVQARSKEALYLPEAPLAALVGMLYHYIAKRA
jgi:hypothetical protein